MKRILVLTNSINGLYSFRQELIEKLIDDGYKVVISSPKGAKSIYFKNIGCEVIQTLISRRGTNPLTDIKLLYNYLGIIRKIKPHIVLTYTIKPNVYGGLACSLNNIPCIANITGLGTAVENTGFLQKITLYLYKISMKNARCVFFQNAENRQFFIENNIAISNNRLIPGSGVNLEHFRVLPYPPDEIIHFVFIGRVMKEKGIEQYLEAASYIKSKYPKTIFHVLGNCEELYLDKLSEYQNKNIIKYHGRQDDVREFHKISHCTIHPTYYPEGMSNVLLESAACGRPIITTNRSGCKEIVDDGINGYVVKQKDSQDLIEKIEKFLKLDYETKRKMSLAGRNKVEKEFERKIVVDAYIREIKKVVR